MIMWLQLCVCASLIYVGYSLCNDSIQPSYTHGSVIWVCENILKKFPASNVNVRGLTCSHCNIRVLDENSMGINFRGPTFNLSGSHIQEVHENAFKLFTNNTVAFIFDNNVIDNIGKKVFSNFSQLKEINFHDNRISKIEAGAFENTNVTLLDLSQNHLTDIPSGLKGLRVSSLNLSSNAIINLQPNAFDGITIWAGKAWSPNRQTLDLSNNFLSAIKVNTFQFHGDSTIRILHLRRNQLTAIENDTFAQLNGLTHLYLDGNSISQLYSNSFKGLSNLRMLNLAHNRLTDLPYGMFGNTGSLDQLDLSQNLLTTLSASTFSGLGGLTKLNISHNFFQTIEDSYLMPLGKLSSLDISDTKLHDFNLKQIMEHHFALYTLVINDNFWTCSKLVQMYKLINRKRMTFSYPSRYFDVPNLHGIACSRQQLESYDNLSFENFLSIIAQDPIIEDLLDYHVTNDSEVSANTGVMRDVNRISTMLIIVTIICTILFIFSIVKYIFAYLRYSNIVRGDKFAFLYAQSQDKVELLP